MSKKINSKIFKDQEIGFSLEVLANRYNYNHWIFNTIREFIGQNVLEIGAGIGNITDFLMTKRKLTLLDINPHYVKYLKNKYSFRKNDSLTIKSTDINKIDKSSLSKKRFDTIIILNVLEHLIEDTSVVQKLINLLSPGGKLIILVPAVPWLYGSIDQAFGHYRRYTTQELRNLFSKQPVKIKKIFYFNFLGIIGWIINNKILKRTEIPDKQSYYFDVLVPFVGLIEKFIKPPLGLSLVCVVEKK